LQKKILPALLLVLSLLLCFMSWFFALAQNQEHKVLVELKELKSPFIVFTIGVRDNRVVHRAITNRITHHTNYLEGEEFILFFQNQKTLSSDFILDRAETLAGQLSYYLKNPSAGLSARLDFKLSDSGAVVEKRLFLKSERGKKIVQKICLIDFRVGRTGEFTVFPGAGQPAYKGNLFFAIAYPLSEVKASGLDLSICYEPHQLIDSNGYLSHTAIIGVSEPAQTQKWFMKYVDEFRHRKAEPYILYNSWYDLPGTVNEEGLIRAIQGIKSHLTDPYGIKLDAVVIDDGWDNYQKLWQFDSQKFPQGIEPVKLAAELIGAKPGMWFSPAGGYAERKYKRITGTLGQGYEKNWLSLNLVRNGFCPAGEKYHQEFKKRIMEMTADGVAYFKLDNIGTTCFVPWHKHPAGKASKVAITDALIDVMKESHRLNPEAYFNITVGSWLSPFWLQDADCVWMGGMDYGFSGPGSQREKNITYKDQNLYRIFQEQNLQFPFNGIMTHGVIKGRHQFPETGPVEEFERDVIMYLARGVSMWELYLSPDILTEQEWSALARWILWAKQNWNILKNTRMVLGDPNKLEIYGYLHQTDEQALLIMRNPSDKVQTLSISPDQLGLPEMSEVIQEYPSSENFNFQDLPIRLELKPFEVKILRFHV